MARKVKSFSFMTYGIRDKLTEICYKLVFTNMTTTSVQNRSWTE